MNEGIHRFVDELERSLPYPDPVREQVVREVRDHLLALVAQYRREGMSQREAETRARDSFGTIKDFVAGFEAEGGPTIASIPAPQGLTTFTGAYVGLVLGLALGLVLGFLFFAWGILGSLVFGALARRRTMLRGNLGPPLGAALGAIVGYVAVAHYLISHSQSSFSQSGSTTFRSITVWATAIGALCGFLIGLIPRLRNDPTPLLWASALGFGGHVVARLWLEDFPTLTSLATLALGVLIGGALGVHRLARRYALVPLGGMLGLTSAFLLMFSGIRYLELFLGTSIVPPYINPAASLPIGAFAGAALGLVMSLRSEPRLQDP